eukprot:m.852648 g.852648  ORF g.852648 m.852648 type:complete len:284 (-) comp23496_c0_seq23:2438-3289(-)
MSAVGVGTTPVRGTNMQSITVWGRPSSSNTQKVLWLLKELDIPHKLILASARLGEHSQLLCTGAGTKPYGVVDTEEYLAMNPHGLIPCIRDPNNDDNVAVWESNTICRYLAEAHGVGTGWYGPTAAHRAVASGWMDWALHGYDHSPCFGSANHHLIDQVARTASEQRDKGIITNAHAQYCSVFHQLEGRLRENAATGAYLTGLLPSVADIPIGVEINRWVLCVAALARDGTDLPMPVLPRLRSLYAALLARPAFVAAVFTAEAAHHNMDHFLPASALELLPEA